VFFFGGIPFVALVTENNKSGNEKSDNNHGKWRDTKNNGKEDSEKMAERTQASGMTIKREQQWQQQNQQQHQQQHNRP
jgi:ABC-type protease/lipase transport system fused ATPase/permease subunit